MERFFEINETTDPTKEEVEAFEKTFWHYEDLITVHSDTYDTIAYLSRDGIIITINNWARKYFIPWAGISSVTQKGQDIKLLLRYRFVNGTTELMIECLTKEKADAIFFNAVRWIPDSRN